MSTALQPPLGGDQNLGHALVGVAVGSFVPALTVVCLRMWIRAKLVRAVGWDDWIIILAILPALVATVAQVVGVHDGLGRHEYYLDPSQKTQAGKYTVVAVLTCHMALAIGKISMCFSLLRIIDGSNQKLMRWFLYLMISIQFVVNVIDVTTLFVQCRPVRKVWTPALVGYCWSPQVQRDMDYLQAITSGVTDFVLAGLPVLILKELRIDRRSKVLLCGLMGFGVFTGILAFFRAGYTHPFSQQNDATFTNAYILILGGMERNLAIIVACIPFLRPLFKKLAAKKSTGYYSREDHYPSGSDPNYKFTANLSSFGRKSESRLSSGGHNKSASTNVSSGRQGSEENILPLHNMEGIWKTTKVRVTQDI